MDILGLIAKILSFSDDQKEIVGLKPVSLITSILSTVVGKPPPPPDIEGDNLAELWVNFLLVESDEKPDTAAHNMHTHNTNNSSNASTQQASNNSSNSSRNFLSSHDTTNKMNVSSGNHIGHITHKHPTPTPGEIMEIINSSK